VGKTTTAVNLAAMIALSGRDVLLVDLDPQGNATTGLGVAKTGPGGVPALFLRKKSFEEVVSATAWPHLHVLPANSTLSRFDGDEEPPERLTEVFEGALEKASKRFEWVLIDCPPSLSTLPRLAFLCCRSVIIPIQPEFYSMEGLSQMVRVVESVKRSANRNLEMEGILFTMFDPRLRFNNEVVEEVRGYFADKVYRTMIPRDVAVAESSSFGKPVLEYDPYSRGARGYVEFAKEVL
jgi:chromosome partitioning protein